MSSETFTPITYDGLSFTNIGVTETDLGSVLPFLSPTLGVNGVDTATGVGLNWSGVSAGAFYANASEVLNIDYTVSAGPSSLIDSASQLYVANYFQGPGISLIAVEDIYDTSGNLIGTDTFNEAGIADDPVTLSEDVQSINVKITLTMAVDQTGTSSSGVQVSAVQQTYGVIAAPPQTASIGDIAFLDIAGTGVENSFNSGPGVAGVTVELLNSTGTSVLATTTTNSSGLYSFTGLSAGVYEVKFVAPTGYIFSPELATNTPAVNSSANPTTGITGPITLTAGEIDNDVEVGLIRGGTIGATIGSTVWMDTNDNGLDDQGEPGVSGVTVDLLSSTGSLVATTTTNASGKYQFTGLTAGVYRVAFLAPGGDIFTQENVNPGTTVELNSVANSSGQTALITLTAGEADNSVNAGLLHPAIEVQKLVSVNGGASFVAAPATNSEPTSLPGGPAPEYEFIVTNSGNVGLNNVVLTDSVISGGAVNLGTLGNLGSLAAGASDTIITKGTWAAGQNTDIATVTGTVIANGVATAPTATATANYLGDTASVSIVKTVTSVGGVAGDPAVTKAGEVIDYKIVVSNTGGATLTNVLVNDITLGTTLASGGTLAPGASDTYTASQTVTQAELDTCTPITNTATVSDSETPTESSTASTSTMGYGAVSIVKTVVSVGGVAGDPAVTKAGEVIDYSIVVTNTGDETLTNVVVKDTILGIKLASLNTLAPGASDTYTASQTVTQAQIVCGGALTNTATVSDTQTPIESSTVSTAIVQPATLGCFVWLDANRDGLDENGETGVAGVTVDLLNSSGTAVLATTTTSSSGLYTFSDLLPGTYEVKFIAPAGDIFSTEGVPVTSGAVTNSSANPTTGVTAPVTLTAGETDYAVNAGLQIAPASIGDIVWFDANKDGLPDNGESGAGGVTVELLNSAGTSVLATTTTNRSGGYEFTDLNPGVYDVKFVAPAGDAFTTPGVGNNAAVNSGANQTTGITAPITLAAGQTDNSVEAGLVNTGAANGITVLKQPATLAVGDCGPVTYTYTVTNTGSTALSNIKIQDNIGSAANPDYISPSLVTSGFTGTLTAGSSLTYTATINQIPSTSAIAGSVSHTTSGSHLNGGCTAWLSASFNPTSDASGATYRFQGITCVLSGGGLGTKSIVVNCPDSVVTFTSSCQTASTVYNASTNCWVTTLPANIKPGSVFLSGAPLTIPAGESLINSHFTWSINDSSNNCGASGLTWDGTCTGYTSFDENGLNGTTNYNDIGVKSSDNNAGFGAPGSVGYGSNGCVGSKTDAAGTPEDQNTQGNSGTTSAAVKSGGSCGDSGTLTQNLGNILGAADTVSVTATTPTSATVTSSDTKEVQLLGNNSTVSVNGTAPTGSLSTIYGTAQTLEFAYDPGSTVSLEQVQAGLGTVSGTNNNTMAFMEISNNANPFASGASIYFEGSVVSGEDIYADATTNVLTNAPIAGGHFSTTPGADIFGYVFASQAAFKADAAPIQTIAYNTSGSQAMHLGDTIGSLSLVGYVGANGGHLVA